MAEKEFICKECIEEIAGCTLVDCCTLIVSDCDFAPKYCPFARRITDTSPKWKLKTPIKKGN
jgi:hypothetical protein